MRRRAAARWLLVATMAALAIAAAPSAVAHPLGNFTINQYAAVSAAPGAVVVDYVVDMAEIPTFQELRAFDTDRDDALSTEEAQVYAATRCAEVTGGLVATLAGQPLAWQVHRQAAELRPGQAGLSTLRLECELHAAASGTGTLDLTNRNYPERLGWREVVLAAPGFPGGLAERLEAYPDDLLQTPPDIRTLTVDFSVPAADAPPAEPATAPAPDSAPAEEAAPRPGAVVRPPDAFASLITKAGLGPLALMAGLAAAFALGIGHALAPGHGKTIMAAYLVGTEGTVRQAGVLALAVAVSHTAGVLVLGLVTLAATSAWQPDRVYPWLSLIAGLVVLGVGISLLVRRRRRGGRAGLGHGHDHGDLAEQHHDDQAGHSHGHSHGHTHELPEGADGRVGWKALAALGLSGGLVPSASAVVLLLGAVHLGRVPLGIALIVAFGLGMAVTLVAVGLALVYAGRWGIGKLPAGPRLAALRRWVPVVMGVLVIALGLVMTVTAARPLLA